MNVAFWDNCLCERGTTVSLYDYAYYNKHLLKNNSFIFYDKARKENVNSVILKFKNEFVVHETTGFNEVDEYIKKYDITHMYIIKAGGRDNRISKIAKNCIHCVFDCYEPHGQIYTSISPWVNGNDGKYPVVPHMINLPNHEESMRTELNIPESATVFGGYGGTGCFDIPFVHKTVYDVAINNPNIYFVFANFNIFCKPLPNIIHLPMIVDVHEKVKFINTTDSMLWGRTDGEVMSMTMGEFSTKNKPIIAMNIGYPGHVYLLGDKALWYKDEFSLKQILLNFDRSEMSKKNWNAYEDYTPEKVIKVFENVFLKKEKKIPKESLVFIKTPKCGSESIKLMIESSNMWKPDEILSKSYDFIFEEEERKYNISVNHILYDQKYINHLNKIMRNNILYFSCVREPLSRAISHYYYSNDHRIRMDFNAFYSKYHDRLYEGYGSHDRINNQMCFYMGFHTLEDLTKENIQRRYDMIFVMEHNFTETVSKYFGFENKTEVNLNKTHNQPKIQPTEEITSLFAKYNHMDHKLYELVQQIYYS